MVEDKNYAIQVTDLVKKFNGFIAVDGISLNIKKAEIFGLLGPNGAGKTTTIFMLSTMLNPSSGSAKVWGYDVVKEKDLVRKSIGIVFQDPSLDDELTGRENLDFHGRLYGMEKDLRKERMDEVLQLVELQDKADSLVKTYSGGMKRRLEIARGLMHHPKVLFLDEPTLGLDPQTRRRLWEYIKNLNKKHGITIILTTHYMEEADFLCSRVAIIDNGRIIAMDTQEKLKDVLGGDVATMDVSDTEKMSKLLHKESYVKGVKPFEDQLIVMLDNSSRNMPKLCELAHKNNIVMNSISLKRPSLEDVFIHYTGRRIREEKANGMDKMRMRRKMRHG